MVSVKDFGAKGDGVTDDTSAFIAASVVAKAVEVPEGTYRLTTPMALPHTASYFGVGTLKFDNAEWWRRGGSSGSVDVRENYTIFYDFEDRSDVTLTYDGVPQAFTWVDHRTIEAAGTLPSVKVKINVSNGYIRLGPVAEQIRSYNLCGNGGGGNKLAPSLPDPLESPKGYDNTSFGARAMLDMTDGVNNTAIGSKALESNQSGANNTAVGFLALYRSSGTGNTAVGSVAGEWLTTGSYNSFLGLGAGEKVKGGSYNVGLGFEAMAEAPDSKYVVAVGYRANGNPGNYSQSNSVYVGAFAGDFAIGSNNTMIGYRAGNCLDASANPGAGTGHDNVGIGMFAMRKNLAGNESVVIGAGAATETTVTDNTVAIGFGACGTTTKLGAFTVSVGWRALEACSGDNNVAIGQQSAKATTSGAGNVSVGSGSLVTNTTGSNNTSIGMNSGRLKLDGSATGSLENTTTVGSDSRVSGSNQVQLGNSATTTYVYGTVQNRSDARDKAEVRDTVLGIDFIMGLRPVDGKWDMRDDYVEEEEYQETELVKVPVYDGGHISHFVEEERIVTKTKLVHLPKDGSKKRDRFHHWFIAQEVKELCDKLGVEFGGYQDHTVRGGCDVLSLGYDEFIPPAVKAIQQCWTKLTELETRLGVLEKSSAVTK
ncbi:MAG: glycosyl hydrolase family 28-related protein [Plesiomonas sp.]